MSLADAYLGVLDGNAMATVPRSVSQVPRVSRARALQAFSALTRWNSRFYDGTANGPDFENHFANATDGSASIHGSAETRRVLRNRCRYELGNNSYLSGIVDTHTYGIVGRCPSMRILAEEARLTERQARRVESFFKRWTKRVKFGKKIRQLYRSRVGDGEGLALIVSNPRLWFPVSLDLKLIECDQLMADPTKSYPLDETKEVDGVLLDEFGNPDMYRILKRHPAGMGWRGITPTDFETIPERYVLHYFRAFRAGQQRGIPEVAPALLPAAALRRYTMAVVKAAEVAASITFLIESDQLGDSEEAPEPYDTVELPHNTGMPLPDGWKGKQLKAEQPTDTYGAFKRELVAEEGRCLGQSANAAAADSSDASFSSARMDDMSTAQIVSIERHDLADDVLAKIMWHFGAEAVLAESALSVQIRNRLDRWIFNEGEFFPHEWRFDAKGYSDPETESKANDIELRNGSRALSDVLMRRDGTTLEEHIDKLKRERKYIAEAGLNLGYMVLDPGAQAPNQQPKQQQQAKTNAGKQTASRE